MKMIYEGTIRGKWSIDKSKTLSEAATRLREIADYYEAMEKAGIQLECKIEDDYGTIVTTNKKAAKKYNLHKPESF